MRPWMILAALAIARAGFGYQFQTVATLGPDLVPLFHLTYADLGTLIGAYMLLGTFIALPLGVLGRRVGDRIVLGGGLVCMVIGAAISAWAGGPDGIAAGRIVSGGGAVAMIVLQNKVISDWFSGRQFILAISISVCAYPIGVGSAQLILPPLAQAYGWPAAFLSGGAALAVALLVFLLSYRPSSRSAVIPRHFSWPSGRECLLLVVAGLMWTAYTTGFAGYISYVPSTLALRGESLALIGLVMTIATWGNVPATLLGGGLAARYGGFRVILIGTAGLVIGMVATAMAGWPVLWAVAVGIVGSVHPGVIIALGTLSARPENRAVGLGLFYSLYYAGGTLAPALCGHAADVYGGPAGALLAASILSAMALPLYLLHRRLAAREMLLVGG